MAFDLFMNLSLTLFLWGLTMMGSPSLDLGVVNICYGFGLHSQF
jgi:hypothetical protein